MSNMDAFDMDEKPRGRKKITNEAIREESLESEDRSGKPAAISIELEPAAHAALKEAVAYETGIPQSTDPPQYSQDQEKDKT